MPAGCTTSRPCSAYLATRLWTTTRTDAAAAALTARGEHAPDEVDAALDAAHAGRSGPRGVTLARPVAGAHRRAAVARPLARPCATVAVRCSRSRSARSPRWRAATRTRPRCAPPTRPRPAWRPPRSGCWAGPVRGRRGAGRAARHGRRRWPTRCSTSPRPTSCRAPPPPSPSSTPSCSGPSNHDSSGADVHDIATAHDHDHAAPGREPGGALRIGIGGPVGSGKTALVAALCGLLATSCRSAC